MKKSYYIFAMIVMCTALIFIIMEANAAFWGKKTVGKKECAEQYRKKCSKKCDSIGLQIDRDKCFKNCEKDLGKKCGYTETEDIRREENPRVKDWLN